jgi:hypothetical protein
MRLVREVLASVDRLYTDARCYISTRADIGEA